MKIVISISLLAILIFAFFTTGICAEREIPKFKIIGNYKRSTFSIVVPKGTSDKQLSDLISEFKNAREENYLSKYFPPTTSGGKFGNYAAIFVYVFTDEKRASAELLNKYMETSEYSKSDKIFAQKYAETVSAYYMYHVLNHQEFGCLGLRDVGVKQTKKYKKLFAANVPY
jgi:hypothetical protein